MSEPRSDAWPRSSALVGVRLPEAEPLAPELVDLIGSLRVVLVGWYRVPEQTTPEQARDQWEAACSRLLDRLVEDLEEAGAEVDPRLVFTPEPLHTLARVAFEESCDAILLARPLDRLDRVLAPLGGAHHLRTISGFLGDLLVGSDARVTFLHVRDEDEEEGFGSWVLEEAKSLVGELGVEAARVETRLIEDDKPVEEVLAAAEDHDVLVLGESEASVKGRLFSSHSERMAGEAAIPVFVIRRRE